VDDGLNCYSQSLFGLAVNVRLSSSIKREFAVFVFLLLLQCAAYDAASKWNGRILRKFPTRSCNTSYVLRSLLAPHCNSSADSASIVRLCYYYYRHGTERAATAVTRHITIIAVSVRNGRQGRRLYQKSQLLNAAVCTSLSPLTSSGAAAEIK